jgi:DNA replication protein DnaC
MNLPRSFWRSTIQGIPESVRGKIKTFVEKVHEAAERGIGLCLLGAHGVGKTSAASVIAKVARSWGYTVYFTSFWELRDAIRNEEPFDESMSVLTRAKTADFLILDNLRDEDFSERDFYLPMRAIEEILSYRVDRSKVTIITTSLTKDDIGSDKLKGLRNSLSGFVKVAITGPNQRLKQIDELKKDFLG